MCQAGVESGTISARKRPVLLEIELGGNLKRVALDRGGRGVVEHGAAPW